MRHDVLASAQSGAYIVGSVERVKDLSGVCWYGDGAVCGGGGGSSSGDSDGLRSLRYGGGGGRAGWVVDVVLDQALKHKHGVVAGRQMHASASVLEV